MISGNPPLRTLLKEAERLGCDVHPIRGTGETAVAPPSGPRLRLNHRRKDSARALVVLVRRLQKETQ